MSSFVSAGVRSVSGKITRSGLDTRTSRPPASTVVASPLAIHESSTRPRLVLLVAAVLATENPNAQEAPVSTTKTRVEKIARVVIPVPDQDSVRGLYVEKRGFE